MRERITMEREMEMLGLRDQGISYELKIKPGGQTVSNTFDVPFRWICRLQVEVPHSKGWEQKEPGTGVLVGPRHVLTAAHVVDPYNKLPAGQWRVIARLAFDGSRDLGEEISSKAYVSKGWQAKKKDALDPGAYDYAMIILPGDITSKPRKELGNKPLGYWGQSTVDYKTVFAPLKAESLEAKFIYCAGYPRGVKRAMWVGAGKLSNILFRTGTKIVRRKRGMNHDAMTSLAEDAHGMSGGPVWYSDSVPCLVGINNTISQIPEADPDGKIIRKRWQAHAARVTIEFFNEVSEWIKANP
ncbi:MAG: serine protease [Blastocatellia bacterium]